MYSAYKLQFFGPSTAWCRSLQPELLAKMPSLYESLADAMGDARACGEGILKAQNRKDSCWGEFFDVVISWLLEYMIYRYIICYAVLWYYTIYMYILYI